MNNVILPKYSYHNPTFGKRFHKIDKQKIATFMNNQTEHVWTQAFSWMTLGILFPIDSPARCVLRKIIIDFAEASTAKMNGHTTSPKYQAFNIFSYLDKFLDKIKK